MDSYLEDVPESKAFVLGHKKIMNLYGLLYEFRNMNDETYSHYVSDHYNYFADWIEHVVHFKELADELRNVKNREESITLVENKIESFVSQKESPPDVPPDVVVEAKPKEEEGFTVSGTKRPDKPEQKKVAFKKAQKEAEEKIEEAKEEVQEEIEEAKEEIQEEAEETVKKPSSMLKIIAKDEREIKEFLWKHFAWDMAKEFMYGLAVGILIGLVLSRIFLPG